MGALGFLNSFPNRLNSMPGNLNPVNTSTALLPVRSGAVYLPASATDPPPTEADGSCSQPLLHGYLLHRLQQQTPATVVSASSCQLPAHPLLTRRPLFEGGGGWQEGTQVLKRLRAAVPPEGASPQLLVLEDATPLLFWVEAAAMCRLIHTVKARGE